MTDHNATIATLRFHNRRLRRELGDIADELGDIASEALPGSVETRIRTVKRKAERALDDCDT